MRVTYIYYMGAHGNSRKGAPLLELVFVTATPEGEVLHYSVVGFQSGSRVFNQKCIQSYEFKWQVVQVQRGIVLLLYL